MTRVKILDCTLRDGGYYNAWDFSPDIISHYLRAMHAARIDIVELGFRALPQADFRGACAYTTDDFIRSLPVPEGLKIGIMVNGAEMLTDIGLVPTLNRLFPETRGTSPVEMVRFACHLHEFEAVLPAAEWLHRRGFRVGFNLMQITEHRPEDIRHVARLTRQWPVEILYFADSLGSLDADGTARVVGWLREEWQGPLGIHTHDNMGRALLNTLRAQAEGVQWLDSTVTGMGRGPGNTRTEDLVVAHEETYRRPVSLAPLMQLVRDHFKPLKDRLGWGSNPYYYLAGQYGIHPTYIQNLQDDPRYGPDEILAAIGHLRDRKASRFSPETARLLPPVGQGMTPG